MNKRIPAVLWVAIVSLGVMILSKADMAAKKPAVMLDAIVSGLLLLGIIRGQKWAYVLTIAFTVLGTAVALDKNSRAAVQVFLLDCLVLIPVLTCTRYFFPTGSPDKEPDDRGD